ncbi:MAG: hypothetical protein NVS3B26_23340 [Mycobacteriales bacterium]
MASDPAGLAVANADDIRSVSGLAFEEILAQLADEFALFQKLNLPMDARFPFHADQSIDGAGARGDIIGELLVHGYDVATAAQRPWALPERDFVLTLNGVFQVGGGWLNPVTSRPVRGDVALRVKGGTPQLFHVADGRLDVRDLRSSDRPDAVIRGKAPIVCLYLYKRITLPQAIRRGVIITGGRRPWTGLSFGNLFLPV